MNKKDLFLVSTGLVLGYLITSLYINKRLYKQVDFKSNEAELFGLAENISPELNKEIKDCQMQNEVFFKTSEFPIGTNVNELKKNKNMACVSFILHSDRIRQYALANS